MVNEERDIRAKIFEDTRNHYRNNAVLQEAVERSRKLQKLILESDEIEPYEPYRPLLMEGECNIYEPDGADHHNITVSRKRSFEAAMQYANRGLNTAVLNFASATQPGGGVRTGAGAQEECLCRCSTLYPCLDIKEMWDGFYSPHRAAQDPIHNGDIIYTPNVVVFKTDTARPELMPEKDWFKVDVITCAAPNLNSKSSNRYNPQDGDNKPVISDSELMEIHINRLTRILETAYIHHCEAVILGAFGCGAFKNPPEIVAKAAKSVTDAYRNKFADIEFAVHCRPGDDRNYRVFEGVLYD